MQNYTSLAHKLGWDDMQSHIAIPAIILILSHYIGMIFDATGDIIGPDDATAVLVANWDANEIFGLLLMDDFLKYEGSEELSQFISLRGEIEDYMRKGYTHEQAIAEWYK